MSVEAVTINEQVVEAAFAHAWQKWACSSRFPQVRAHAGHNDIVAILRGSARRLGAHIADWSCAGEYIPELRTELSLEQAGAAVGEQLGVTHDQWLELAAAFVEQLHESEGEIRYRR